MPKKLDYTYIQNYIKISSGGKAKLISKEYINSNTPLLFQCECGSYFKKTFNKCKNGFYLCSNCLNKYRSKKYSYDIDFIKQKISEKGCEYLSGEYINNTSLLKLKCKCGNIFEKDYNHFKRQPQCPQCGNDNLRKSKTKYDIKYAKEYFKSRGFELLENEYKGCNLPMFCRCVNGHEQYKKMSYLMQQKNGCNLCVINNNKGENHWNYKGGANELFDMLRKELKKWKLDVLKDRNFKCELTQSRSNLEVHHLKNFIDIVYETLNQLKLPLYRKCSKYTLQQLDDIKNLFCVKHSLDLGVVLTKKNHKLFHSIYGIHNNTKEQFEEFKRNFTTE